MPPPISSPGIRIFKEKKKPRKFNKKQMRGEIDDQMKRLNIGVGPSRFKIEAIATILKERTESTRVEGNQKNPIPLLSDLVLVKGEFWKRNKKGEETLKPLSLKEQIISASKSNYGYAPWEIYEEITRRATITKLLFVEETFLKMINEFLNSSTL